MTFNEMRRKCLQKYIELWGEEWVEARKPSIGDGYTEVDENGILEYLIDQDDCLLEEISNKKNITDASEFVVILGNTPPKHTTRFRCNMKTGEIEVIDHR